MQQGLWGSSSSSEDRTNLHTEDTESGQSMKSGQWWKSEKLGQSCNQRVQASQGYDGIQGHQGTQENIYYKWIYTISEFGSTIPLWWSCSSTNLKLNLAWGLLSYLKFSFFLHNIKFWDSQLLVQTTKARLFFFWIDISIWGGVS